MNLLKPAILIVTLAAIVVFITANMPPMDKNYDEKWKEVDSLVNLNQPRSALESVEQIYQLARIAQNSPQLIKANLYRIKLMADFEEDHMVKAISTIQKEIEDAGFPDKQILHSILGDLFLRYFQMNRYQVLDRGKIAGDAGNDIQTWDAAKLLGTAASHFEASLVPENELQNTDLKPFAAILDEKKDSKIYRPTLFDFLAHRAIGFYSSGESGITTAADQWKPDHADYFSSAERFINLQIPENKSHTYTAKILKIYQKLLRFHTSDADPQALIDADLQRLNYVRDNSLLDGKDGHYRIALESLQQRFSRSPLSASVAFELAKFHESLAMKYNPAAGDDFRWERKKAVDICQEAIKKFPKSPGAANCQILLDELVKPSISVQTETASLPGKPSLSLLSWRNYNKVWFRLISINYKDFQNLSWRIPVADLAARLVKLEPMQTWSFDVPNELDYQQHSTEFIIPPLPSGFYLILASTDQSFSVNDQQLAWADFWITNLTFTSKRLDRGGQEFFVLDRLKGTPKSGVSYKVFTRDYDYKTREYSDKLMQSGTSDRNGYFAIEPQDGTRNPSVTIHLSEKKDSFSPATSFYIGPPSKPDERPVLRSFFFTDRAIYRPGQTVYFKAIVIEKIVDKQEVKSDHNLKIEFFDVNYQLISSVNLTTNEFGAVNGSFTIPSGILNGQMTIRNSSGSTVIQVEDYKRPTFEVDFQPVQSSFRLNAEITVVGEVKAYAGNQIDDAKVKYRIVRRSYFPYRWIYSWNYFPQSPEIELVVGETITDSEGRFSINFTAVPDQEVNRNFKPVFQYTIYASVTDISGETQSGEQTISVGHEALFLDVDIPEKLDQRRNPTFKLSAENFDGVKQETVVKVEISRLNDPGKLLTDRLWDTPDQFVITPDQFAKDFPGRAYRDENKPENWMKAETVLNRNFNTSNDTLLMPENLSQWKQGKYLVSLSATDAFGQTVETKKYFDVFNPADTKPPLTVYNWFTPLKTSGEPGEEASFLIGSAARGARALYEVQLRGKTLSREWINLDREQKLIKVPIREEFRGNFNIQITMVANNREFNNQMTVTVPFTNKQLDLAFETFRSQLEPGSAEEWKIKVSNKNGEQVAAQLLASMYDASLDAFVKHNWYFDLYQPNGQATPWQSSGSVGVSRGNQWDFTVRPYKSYTFNEYDQLNWFGFGGFGYDNIYYMKGGPMQGSRMGVANATEMSVEAGQMQMDGINETGTVPSPEAAVEEPEKARHVENFPVRRDFSETAFFYPVLQTNEQGEVIIRFTLPESFTRWKFMALGTTKDLMTGMLMQEFTASKKLMVIPNAPRFFRMGDTITFTSKISNLSEEVLSGTASLELFNPISMKPVNESFGIVNNPAKFTAEGKRSTTVSWQMVIPEDFGVITYRVKATAGNYTDGEEKSIPVLPNRMLVTESLPLPISGAGSKDFKFKKLLESDKSTTIRNQNLTVEFASNPAWYAIQALPVVSEPVHKNALSVFAAFYANSIAFYISNGNPKIRSVFESWKNQTPESFLSNLDKNQELKALLLEQTPWVLQARDENERKQRVALLFDLNNMRDRLDVSIRTLEQMQSANGGFYWFEGMPESRYITQNIVEGLGKLHSMRIIDAISDERINRIITRAVRYLDERIRDDYDEIIRFHKDKLEEDHLSGTQIQFLFARSFFPHIMMNPSYETAFNYFKSQAAKYWTKQNTYLQGMIALSLQRYGNQQVPKLIVKSLQEKSLTSEEMGMYWRIESGYYWFQSPVETQAMMIAVFDEVAGDKSAVEHMKIWLLKQKQTQDWKTTRATVDAVYALLKRGRDLLAGDALVKIEIAGQEIDMKTAGKVEAGTGYFSKSWSSAEIKPQMGNISLTKPDDGIAWGAMYWQYFEDLDRITPHATPLSLQKQLYVERISPAGTVLEKVNDRDILKVGDKVTVRIELRVDRDLEYVHMQDMRASALEPVNVLSGYKYRGGLGYYESTRDAATNFYFDYLRKGTYVFEYPLIATQTGNFSNGISTIQCMYAPEFSAHSKGIRVVVE